MNPRALVIILILVLLLGAGAAFLYWRQLPENQIVGKWTRTDTTVCSLAYPTRIVFERNDTYWVEGLSPWWRGGSYAVDESRIRMDTSDGSTSYSYQLVDDRLTFTNSLGCAFSYARE
ncbi:MAG TPA: hypothetical protein VFO89_02150 [Thermoanaerobaculia bacterium]|nr:hypothetical protein [Thermoanaerobaculia bacterium]